MFLERGIHNEIMNYKNVILTPHAAWGAYEARVRCVNAIASNIQAYIDKKTQNNCYREGTSQALNVLSAATVTLKLTTLGWWNWILAGFTAAAGFASGFASAKQFKWAGEVGNEIKMREGVQAHTENTKAVYEAEKENFEVSLADIKGLELEVPKEYDADVSALPTDNNQANPDSLLLINSQNEDNQINNNENPNDSDPNNRKPEEENA